MKIETEDLKYIKSLSIDEKWRAFYRIVECADKDDEERQNDFKTLKFMLGLE